MIHGMKTSKLKERLGKNRPMTTISLRFPEDVIEDLKRVAPLLGLPLIRAYVGQGLRVGLEKLEDKPDLSEFVERLRRKGVDDSIIASAMAEAKAEAS
jgi:hypothetical protein